MKTNREILYGVPTNVFEKDTHLGFTYYIVESYLFPCAYVVVPKKLKKAGDILDLVVHGGITYSKPDFYLEDVGKNNWVFGWDYGHGGDFMFLDETITLRPPKELRGKMYTREDIMRDIDRAISAILFWRDSDEKSE